MVDISQGLRIHLNRNRREIQKENKNQLENGHKIIRKLKEKKILECKSIKANCLDN